jgi:hypothetical protein
MFTDEQLISQVQNYKYLYDPPDNLKKENGWSQIAAFCDTTGK